VAYALTGLAVVSEGGRVGRAPLGGQVAIAGWRHCDLALMPGWSFTTRQMAVIGDPPWRVGRGMAKGVAAVQPTVGTPPLAQ
jgi:hypothetical protein